MKNLKKVEKKPGVYIVYDCISKKCYIGSSRNLYERIQAHFERLKKKNHYCPEMQECFNNNGIDNFAFNVLEYADVKDRQELYELEEKWIQKFIADGRKLFNRTFHPSHSTSGYKFSEQSIERLKKQRGTPEYRQKMSNSLKISRQNPEYRKRMEPTWQKRSQEMKAIRANPDCVYNSLECRQKKSNAVKGDKNPNCKLKSYMAEEIKRLYYEEHKTKKEIAEKYGVCPDSIRSFFHRYINTQFGGE